MPDEPRLGYEYFPIDTEKWALPPEHAIIIPLFHLPEAALFTDDDTPLEELTCEHVPELVVGWLMHDDQRGVRREVLWWEWFECRHVDPPRVVITSLRSEAGQLLEAS